LDSPFDPWRIPFAAVGESARGGTELPRQIAEFKRRNCRFNLLLLQAALQEYKAAHPEAFH
jgi:hypothetical protein